MYWLHDYETFAALRRLEDHWRDAEREKIGGKGDARPAAVFFAVVLCACAGVAAFAPTQVTRTVSVVCEPELAPVRPAVQDGPHSAMQWKGTLDRIAMSMAHPCAS